MRDRASSERQCTVRWTREDPQHWKISNSIGVERAIRLSCRQVAESPMGTLLSCSRRVPMPVGTKEEEDEVVVVVVVVVLLLLLSIIVIVLVFVAGAMVVVAEDAVVLARALMWWVVE